MGVRTHHKGKAMTADAVHMQWCKSLMLNLAEGGTWGVPRSGLTYVKRGNALVLKARGPSPDIAAFPEGEWREYQDDDHATTKRVFEAAGFEIHDESRAP